MQLEEDNESYLCICPTGYSGDLCQIINVQGCFDKDQQICPKLSAYCKKGTYKDVPVKDFCPKTCQSCP